METWATFLIFSLELEIPGMVVQRIHQNNFEAVLATCCCYDYGANASKAVQKIATDQKDYHK